MRKFFLLCIALFLGFQSVDAQPWMELLPQEKREAGTYNFYDVQAAFNQYWEGREIEKGKGWKQFKRWEWFMEPRVYPTGEFPAGQLWNVYQKQANAGDTESTAEWTHLGPFEVPVTINGGSPRGVGRINAVEFHPTNSDIIYTGAPSGGFWKTTDGGQSWITTTDNLVSIGVSSILVNPQNPDEIYIATGDGDAGDTYTIGVLRSADGGNTWSPTALTYTVDETAIIRSMIMHPADPEIIIAASSEGVIYTDDGFATYSVAQEGHFKDIEFKPGDPSVVYAAKSGWGSSSVYKSTDGGLSFSEAINGMSISSLRRIELAVTPDNSNVVYALCSDTGNGLAAVYKSTDSGENWVQVADGYPNLLGWDVTGGDSGGQGWYDLSLAVSPTDENMVYVGGVNIWRSTDGGENWEINGHWTGAGTADYVHADQHILKYRSDGVLFSGNDGGLYQTEDGVEWTDISDNLHILQMYRLGTSATDEAICITGTQDNGTFKRNGETWNAVIGGDGMECIIDHTDPNIMYGSLYYGSIYKSTNGGYSFFSVSAATGGAWVTPYIMHPEDNNTLYAGYTQVYKTTTGGTSWESISDYIAGGNRLNALALAPSDDNYIYTSSGSAIWRTTDGGENWESITPGLPDNYITYITVAENDPEFVAVTLSGYDDNEKVFVSTDAGTTWTNYSDGLPNVPANCITYQNGSNDLFYVGTDWGVYVRNSSMSEWVAFNDGLPNVIVNELEIHYATNKLRAATYGRGMWESPLYYDETSPLEADFAADITSACTDGTPVTFTDYSYGVVSSYDWNFGEDANPATATGIGPHAVSYSTAGSKTITLTISGPAGTDTETKTGYITGVTELTVEVSPEAPEMCGGSTVALTATGALDYEWSPATGLNTTTGGEVIASPAETTTYTVNGSMGTCTGDAEVTVNVNIPENDLAANATLLSMGQNGFFTNECADVEMDEPLPPLTGCNGQMSWCDEGGLQNSVWFYFEAPESGTIAIETDGFDNQIALYDADTWNDLFIGNYTLLAANDDYFDADYSATITGVNNLTPGRTYWLQMDGSAGGSVGSCLITLTELTSGIDNVDNEQVMNIFPNPNRGVFDVQFSVTDATSEAIIEVFDNKGVQVYSDYMSTVNGKQQIQLNLSGQKSGIYYVRLTCGTQQMQQKVIIE